MFGTKHYLQPNDDSNQSCLISFSASHPRVKVKGIARSTPNLVPYLDVYVPFDNYEMLTSFEKIMLNPALINVLLPIHLIEQIACKHAFLPANKVSVNYRHVRQLPLNLVFYLFRNLHK